MSSVRMDGGPAFPGQWRLEEGTKPQRGMTLRDYFAAKAMQAMIAKSNGQDRTGGKQGVPLIAQFAYEYADALLASRNSKEKD